MDNEKCKNCGHYKVLNPHFIVNGEPQKFCDLGEHPDYCRIEFERPVKKDNEYFFGRIS